MTTVESVESVESLYSLTTSVIDSRKLWYVERFTQDILDAISKGLYSTKLYINDCDFDWHIIDENPHPYICTSIEYIKKKYIGIQIKECKNSDGYLTHFIVSWDTGVLYNLSKRVNDIKINTYVEQYTKDILDATNNGLYYAKLYVDECDCYYGADGNPYPYVYASIEHIKKKYIGIYIEEYKFGECDLTYFLARWDADICAKYRSMS